MTLAPWIAAFWRWLHPAEAELTELERKRRQIVTEARIHSATVRLQSRGLRRETGAEHDRLKAEMGPINELLAQMDKRRND